MDKKQKIVYLKLDPYLQDYWRWAMHLSADAPLVLPAKEHKELFVPFLRENIDNRRRGGVNNKGYFKDATSFSEYSYIHSPYNPNRPSLTDIDGDKFPCAHDYAKLVAFAMPDEINRNADIIRTTDRYEIHQRGCKYIRDYIREECMQDLHAYILGKSRAALAHGRIINITREVDIWKASHCIRDGAPLREMLYSRGNGDTDSLRRTIKEGINSRKLRRLPS